MLVHHPYKLALTSFSETGFLAIPFISLMECYNRKADYRTSQNFPAFIMIVASLTASPIGVNVRKKVNTKILQGILSY
nr:hypothetical protein [Bacillus methanolicus]